MGLITGGGTSPGAEFFSMVLFALNWTLRGLVLGRQSGVPVRVGSSQVYRQVIYQFPRRPSLIRLAYQDGRPVEA